MNLGEDGGVDKPGQVGPAVDAATIPAQLVDVALAPATPVHQDVLEVDQAVQVGAHLEVRPAAMLAQLPAGKPQVPPVDAGIPAALGNEALEMFEQAAGLGASSSRERPSTSWASRLASAMSDRVASMYSTRSPACTTVLCDRWCWWSRAIARISVRYLVWSLLVRVRSSAKVSLGA
jgi:hypothetical protein